MRYRISIAARALHERGTGRATTVLHRSINRGFQRTDELERCASDHMRRRLRDAGSRWRDLDRRLRRMDLRLRFAEVHRKLASLRTEACQAITLRLTKARGRLDPLSAQLKQLSPLNVLERGYAIVQDSSGHVMKEPGEAPAGTALNIRLAGGILPAESKLDVKK
jgi:exodeoxyribonuclease VII large subunit